MQIGFNVPTTGPLIEPDSLVRIVTEGEALGFDYVTISDHIMVPRNLQSKYPYTGTGEFPAGASAAWLEQLIAESTGKQGKGLVPVVGEAAGAPGAVGVPSSAAVPATLPWWLSGSRGGN